MAFTIVAENMQTKPAKALQGKPIKILHQADRTIFYVLHFGKPALVEEKPIEVAKISLNGGDLHHSVLLHPRYAADKEKIKVFGFRRGRTLDVLLEDPVEIGGEKFGILNFKGVGAVAADRDMVIHPSMWHSVIDGWHAPDPSDTRIFGALKEKDARSEFYNPVLSSNGISIAPHVSINKLPPDVLSNIAQAKDQPFSETVFSTELSQIVRACETNVRFGDWRDWQLQIDFETLKPHIDVDRLATQDSQVVNIQRKLMAEEGSTLRIDGNVADNRFVDGRFTDMENYKLISKDSVYFTSFPAEVIFDSVRFMDDKSRGCYFKILEKNTGLPFVAILENSANMRLIKRTLDWQVLG